MNVMKMMALVYGSVAAFLLGAVGLHKLLDHLQADGWHFPVFLAYCLAVCALIYHLADDKKGRK